MNVFSGNCPECHKWIANTDVQDRFMCCPHCQLRILVVHEEKKSGLKLKKPIPRVVTCPPEEPRELNILNQKLNLVERCRERAMMEHTA